VLQSDLLVRNGLMQRRTYILDHVKPVKHVASGHTEDMGEGGVPGVAGNGNAGLAELLDLQRTLLGGEWLLGLTIAGIEKPRFLFVKSPAEVRPDGQAP
jgi:hypothetical protein